MMNDTAVGGVLEDDDDFATIRRRKRAEGPMVEDDLERYLNLEEDFTYLYKYFIYTARQTHLHLPRRRNGRGCHTLLKKGGWSGSISRTMYNRKHLHRNNVLRF